jgi:hypothetical protein
LNIKTLIDDGCTVKLVYFGSNNWVLNVQYSKVVRGDTLGVRNTAGKLTSLNVVAATVDRTVTFPNADVNLGTVPSVATAYGTLTAGQIRGQILGGSGNTIGATSIDCIAVGTTDYTLNSKNQIAVGVSSIAGADLVTCSDTLITGGTMGYNINVVHRLRPNGNGILVVASVAETTSTTLGLTNTPKAILTRGSFICARHELTFTASVYSSPGVRAGTITGTRLFAVHYTGASTTDNLGDYTVSSVVTPYADIVSGNCSVVFSVTIIEVAVTKEKLLSIEVLPKNASGTSAYVANTLATVTSTYSRI